MLYYEIITEEYMNMFSLEHTPTSSCFENDVGAWFILDDFELSGFFIPRFTRNNSWLSTPADTNNPSFLQLMANKLKPTCCDAKQISPDNAYWM